ncbi:hypothetical protein [Sphingomonas sp.]|uniref:hypothetical protein n=1 Tax=Sphingomonas sp. TaxID=28214 RepID=UPI0035A864DC
MMRLLLGLLGLASMFGAPICTTPATAQFFFKSPELTRGPVTGAEPGITLPLPGATPAETRAGLVWSLRAALNIAALRCQFEPTLLSVSKYNAMLKDHDVELKSALATLNQYFTRTAKVGRKKGRATSGTAGLDQYGTRLYSLFSNVGSQYLFCQTTADIGHDALIAPRGKLYTVAENRMRELRSGMLLLGEQAFGGRLGFDTSFIRRPRFEEACWDRRNVYNVRGCGWH